MRRFVLSLCAFLIATMSMSLAAMAQESDDVARHDAARERMEAAKERARQREARREQARLDKERKRAEAIAVLQEQAAQRATDAAQELGEGGADKYAPSGGQTYCNFFLRDYAKAVNGRVPNELNGRANDMYDRLDESKDWTSFDVSEDPDAAFEAAQHAANEGKLVVVAYKNPSGHGHVAAVVPSQEDGGAMGQSGSWGTKVPWIAQAGRSVFGYKKLSYGFSSKRKSGMKVFVYDPRRS